MLFAVDRSEASEPRSLSYEIVSAVAAKEGVDPVGLAEPEYESLYNVVNPEALDALFAPRENGSTRSAGQVEFTFCDYLVTVGSDGTVEVHE